LIRRTVARAASALSISADTVITRDTNPGARPLAVTIYQGDWTWVGLCVVVLGFFVWWLLVGQARRTATLQQAIDANRALIESKPARARRRR
jgi:bacteriorhodopsin